MTIGPAHKYITLGLTKGLSEARLNTIVKGSESVLSAGLPPVISLNHISHYTSVSYKFLRDVVERNIYPYQDHNIEKRSGGFRRICAPYDDLKNVQSWLTTNILNQISPHWRCFSFHNRASIKSCAEEHCLSRWLIKIDIERFFESISEIDIYNFFLKLGYSPLVSFELARICSVESKYVGKANVNRWIFYHRKNFIELPYSKKKVKYIGHLPQGAPTSPQLSNLIFNDLDEIFEKIALEQKLVYTRYADDIAFSSRQKSFSRQDAECLINRINTILNEKRYNPNHKKVRIIPPGARKVVLGLNVDGPSPKLTKEYKNRLENHIRNVEKFGLISHADHMKFKTIHGMVDHVRGLTSYAIAIEPDYGSSVRTKFEKILKHCDFE